MVEWVHHAISVIIIDKLRLYYAPILHSPTQICFHSEYRWLVTFLIQLKEKEDMILKPHYTYYFVNEHTFGNLYKTIPFEMRLAFA